MGEGQPFNRLRLSWPLFKEESQHFSGGVGAVRIGVSAVWAAAGPGMTAPVHEPLLNDYRASLVPAHSPGMPTNCSMAGFLDTLTSSRLGHVGGIRRIDDVVRIAMENNGANAWAVVASAARFPQPRALSSCNATHGGER